MVATIHTPNLLLRALTEADAQAMFEYFSQEAVMQYYGQDPYQTIDEAKALIQLLLQNETEMRGARWGIVKKDEQKLIGTIGFNLLNLKNKRTEIGYELHPLYWRKGYASEAVQAIIDYGFKELGLERIAAIVYLDNTGSNGLLAKLGFQKEGILRRYLVANGQSHDVYMHALLRSEWE
ncbi:GNAT family N-acetyltransferase [Paenibacillus sp. KN14-4R]|uniref:GNAT family N-acetyltransferase n=1 Tax=Paenibacillus sp. KN14-4R TaxID=3445773 RepID=UPI003FA07DCE